LHQNPVLHQKSVGCTKSPFALGGRAAGRPTLATVTVSHGAILCDFDGCWNALVVSSPDERFTPPVNDIIQHRAWVNGWWTDDQEQDFCPRHPQP